MSSPIQSGYPQSSPGGATGGAPGGGATAAADPRLQQLATLVANDQRPLWVKIADSKHIAIIFGLGGMALTTTLLGVYQSDNPEYWGTSAGTTALGFILYGISLIGECHTSYRVSVLLKDQKTAKPVQDEETEMDDYIDVESQPLSSLSNSANAVTTKNEASQNRAIKAIADRAIADQATPETPAAATQELTESFKNLAISRKIFTRKTEADDDSNLSTNTSTAAFSSLQPSPLSSTVNSRAHPQMRSILEREKKKQHRSLSLPLNSLMLPATHERRGSMQSTNGSRIGNQPIRERGLSAQDQMAYLVDSGAIITFTDAEVVEEDLEAKGRRLTEKYQGEYPLKCENFTLLIARYGMKLSLEIDSSSIDDKTLEDVLCDLFKNQGLKKINMLILKNTPITGALLKKRLGKFNQLFYLQLENSSNLNAAYLEQTIEAHMTLKYFKFNNCRNLSADFIHALKEEGFIVDQDGQSNYEEVMQNFERAIDEILAQETLTEQQIDSARTRPDFTVPIHVLESYVIPAVDQAHFNYLINALSARNRILSSLSIRDGSQLTANSIDYLANQLRNLPLTTISFNACPWLTIASLQPLLSFENLAEIHIENCSEFTLQQAQNFSRSLESLKRTLSIHLDGNVYLLPKKAGKKK